MTLYWPAFLKSGHRSLSTGQGAGLFASPYRRAQCPQRARGCLRGRRMHRGSGPRLRWPGRGKVNDKAGRSGARAAPVGDDRKEFIKIGNDVLFLASFEFFWRYIRYWTNNNNFWFIADRLHIERRSGKMDYWPPDMLAADYGWQIHIYPVR